MSTIYRVVLVTVPNREAADKVSDALLNSRLAACVNQIPRVRSAYWWQGKIERSMEYLLVVKTRAAVFAQVAQCVKENHPYKVPEVISLSIDEGSKAYLDWLGAATPFPSPSAPA